MLRPDGSPAPGSPFNPGSIWGAGGIDRWQRSCLGLQLRTRRRPYGVVRHADRDMPSGNEHRRSDFPARGYKGGGMQFLVDASIDPAGDVWVSNNGQHPVSCYGKPDRGFRPCGGQGIVVFYGMAKPVKAPQIGPVRQP